MPRTRSASPKRRQKSVTDPKTLEVFQIIIANYCEFEVLVDLYCSAKALWPCFQSITAKIYNAEHSHFISIETLAKWEIYFKCYRRPLLTKHIAHKCLLYQMVHRLLACNYVDLALEISRRTFQPKHFVRGVLLNGRIETFVRIAEIFDDDDRKQFIKLLLERFWSVPSVFSNSLYYNIASKYELQSVPLPSNSTILLYLRNALEFKSTLALDQIVETLNYFVMSPIVFGQSFRIRFRQLVIARRSLDHVVLVNALIQSFTAWKHPYSQPLIGKLLVHMTLPSTMMAV